MICVNPTTTGFKFSAILTDDKNFSEICLFAFKKPVTKTYVREKLNNILPFYMIPAYIIFLENIPMTSNEKVDIEKLPLPTDLDIVKNSNIIIPPKNKKESIILELYKKVLNKNDIGVNHNFFEFSRIKSLEFC